MPDFRKLLSDSRIHIYDGGYGTLLQARGLPAGRSPELWGLEEPEVIRQTHRDYIAAGAEILTSNTFGGSAPKLEGAADVRTLNRTMAQLAREVAGNDIFVSGSVGPTGLFVQPLGPLSFRDMVDIYKEQIEGLVEGGVDLIKAETHFDLAEIRAVVVATRLVCDLPILTSMTFEGGVSLTGTPPDVFVETMQNMGVELIGVNCSAGPVEIMSTVRRMGKVLETPLHVQPNAGLPQMVDGKTVFRLDPETFSSETAKFATCGAKTLGGCCGTTPDHIRALAEKVRGADFACNEPEEKVVLSLTSRSASTRMGFGLPSVIIGERINPTGKQRLIDELQQGEFGYAMALAEEQMEAGAGILDVNVGAPMVEEKTVLPALGKLLVERAQIPLCFDSNDMDAIEECLWNYPGSPLINSISGEPGRMERLGPLCKLFGAPFILLPLIGRKLPVSAQDRLQVIDQLLTKADDLGIPRRLICVDALVLTVSSKPQAGAACLEVIRHCRDKWGLATTMGLSNISFGLPARELINTNFAVMSMASGLTSFISNPGSARMREAMAAAEVLLGRDAQAENFIAGYSDWKPGSGGGAGGTAKARRKIETLGDAVIVGARDDIEGMIQAELDTGRGASAIVNEDLIPAIMEVGEKYERKEYFLPQLMLSAETMQRGFNLLRPLLEKGGATEEKAVIIMATVEGDIHDIGKNIVCLMLRNHGFEVFDLGKDVSAARIVDEAAKAKASVIGLSALMTTTMVKMKDVVTLVRERGLAAKVMVGGAVVTQDFADSIGADGYSADAVAAVKLAKQLCGA
ncbi:MAG: homocysteine S-methyltransferase family protein [Desulfovibrio sp.]|uniref:homocysteine S-methyltransferase family protein n=1 Tax=Desulfovibrio sp. 7SRBS1 TaxID=3378064 RepID=UPI003B4120F3